MSVGLFLSAAQHGFFKKWEMNGKKKGTSKIKIMLCTRDQSARQISLLESRHQTVLD